MNAYITLDGNKYTTLHRNWQEGIVTPSTARILLNNEYDSTFGPASKIMWEGEIKIDVNESRQGWGSIGDLKVTCRKKQRGALIDHYGNSYDAHIRGYKQRSLSPMWDGPSNVMYYTVMIEAKYA